MELVKRNDNLPITLKELTKFVLIGREKLVSVRAEIRAIDKIGLATEVREQKKNEAQDLAGALLDAETRIGKLLKDIKIKPLTDSTTGRTIGSEKILPEGINKKQSHYYQAMAAHPEIVEQVKAEAKENDDLPTRTEVLRVIKQKENEKQFSELKKREIKNPDGKYDVIVIDPPWEINKIDRDITPEQTGFDYPTMTVEQIKNIKLPMTNNCHVFMWTTQKYLSIAFNIFETWGLKYVLTFVWHKNGGFQPFNLPQYNCEFIIYGRQGSPKFSDIKDFFTCFDAKRTGHSKKPDEFYDMVKRVTIGRRLDMFNRRAINGFDVWGNESGNNRTGD